MTTAVRPAERAERAESLRDSNERRCRRILSSAAPLQTSDLPWDEIGHHRVAPAVIDCLVYMRDVEGFTDRDLVGLVAHRSTLADPVIRPFLDIWREEEAGHARALDSFLRRYAEATGTAIPARQMPPPAAVCLVERVVARLGGPVGRTVTAAHMTWGAANELLTLNGYRLLARRCGHPLLEELLARIAAQEARHFSFYFLQAQWRLSSSRLARAALSRVMSDAWTPVGIGDGYKPQSEYEVVLTYLSSGEDGQRAIDRMNEHFRRLPGFERSEIYRGPTAEPRPAPDAPTRTGYQLEVSVGSAVKS